MLLLPGITLRVLQFVLPVMKTVTDDRAMCMFMFFYPGLEVPTLPFIVLYVYPGIFLTAALGRSSIMLREVVASWSQAVRDKEFLVEMRLKNLDESEKAKEREKEVGLGA
jgi:E3 ubiquitin-protein ligase MARCH6